MKERSRGFFCITVILFLLFIFWTIAVGFFDVKAIGPKGTMVGFATLNELFHKLTGVNMLLYEVTDWLGLVPLCFVLGFAILGLLQLIKRKSFSKVDSSILVLGGFFIVVFGMYIIFEIFVINYRPILINGYLEASYPSSTTLLVMCVMPTVIMQLNNRVRNKQIRITIISLIFVFAIFMVIGRLISGVHWFTDIVGGVLLSGGLVMLYYCVVSRLNKGYE